MFKVTALAFAVLVAGLLCCASVAPAQVSVGVTSGRLPCALTGTSTMRHMTVLLTVIMGPIGLLAECLLEPVLGFTDRTAFSVMSTTDLTLITVTLGHYRSAGPSVSTTSRETEARDGRGNVGNAGHDAKTEHALPGYRGGGHGGGHH